MLDDIHSFGAQTRDRIERLAIVALAGPRAQKQHDARGYGPYHGAADYDSAAKLAMRVSGGSDGASLLLRYWRSTASDLVRVRWPEISAVATALLERGTQGTYIRQAIRNAS